MSAGRAGARWFGLLLVLALVSAPAGAAVTAPRETGEVEAGKAGFKRIVVCLDGTWNNPYREKARYVEGKATQKRVIKPTNVLKTCRAVLPVAPDGVRQISYYDIGVGGLNKHPGVSNRLLKTADSVLGGAWGAGFESRIEDAYRFIAYNYEPGDEVFVFGFSRGAATARGLCRFIEWMGGVPAKSDIYWAPLFFRRYQEAKGRGAASPGRKMEIRPVKVKFLGVWETVLALGSRLRARNDKKAFYVGESPPAVVEIARQALAVDERRFDFLPEIWSAALDGQDMEQRWFAGVHSNIGGGYVDDGLANLALSWMLLAANESGLGLDWPYLYHYKPYPQDALYNSRKLMYKIKESVTFRRGKGVRELAPASGAEWTVAGANISIDCSVFQRLETDPQLQKSDSRIASCVEKKRKRYGAGEYDLLPAKERRRIEARCSLRHPEMGKEYGPGTKSLENYLAVCDYPAGGASVGCLPVSGSVALLKRESPRVSRCKLARP